ncbi:hypothetical protein [Novosphingobium sp. 9]|uniref:hypothetical protein n=1 Tax=Novosphingobium sp. 9 TaxID=2025349 RepID=UPI0021B52037|nr:hypothetical protein [Novosphingobium sp. 9]
MSPGDFMGFCAFLIATIIIFAILAGAYKRRLAFMERKLEITAGASTKLAAEKAAQYAAHNAQLENRVRVLERILTDGGSALGLAHQIEALRDTSAHDTTALDARLPSADIGHEIRGQEIRKVTTQ